MGYVFTSEGRKADPFKTKAVIETPVSANVPALEWFLGIVLQLTLKTDMLK